MGTNGGISFRFGSSSVNVEDVDDFVESILCTFGIRRGSQVCQVKRAEGRMLEGRRKDGCSIKQAITYFY